MIAKTLLHLQLKKTDYIFGTFMKQVKKKFYDNMYGEHPLKPPSTRSRLFPFLHRKPKRFEVTEEQVAYSFLPSGQRFLDIVAAKVLSCLGLGTKLKKFTGSIFH